MYSKNLCYNKYEIKQFKIFLNCFIKDVIGNKKRPDMICGYLPDTGDRGTIPHNIVAYGYFTSGTYNGKYLTHYGWDNHTQCIVDRPFLSGYDWSIINESSHQHRYIFNVNGEMRCGCEY